MAEVSSTVSKLLADALQHHRAGRLNDAEQLYRFILTIAPRHPDGLHLLGLLAHQTGRPDLGVGMMREAIALDAKNALYHFNLGGVLWEQRRLDEAVTSYRKGLALQPDYPEAFNTLGKILRDQGRLDEAVSSYRKALALQSDHPDTLFNLGSALQEQGLPDEAIACYRRAVTLQSDQPRALNNLGTALQELGLQDEAFACYRRALELQPDYPEALGNLGNALREQGRLDEAVTSYSRALELKPDYLGVLINLGNVLRDQGHLDEAVTSYRRGLELKPDDPEILHNLGDALRDRGQPDEASRCYRRALELKPNQVETVNGLGSALQEQGLPDEAIACYRRALELKPGYPEALNNLGNALRDRAQLDEAIISFRKALELEPDLPWVHHNLALTLLARGDLKEGWEEYEWRWKTPSMIKAWPGFAQPQWRGEPAQGRTLLIHAEQGFGDTLQFCRYARLAAARGLRVFMAAPKPLIRLLGSLEGVDTLVGFGDELPPFDLHCPMMSLPLALKTTSATIPSAVSYLSADATEAAIWRTRLDAALPVAAPRIGLVWAGSAATTNGRRSIAPERLAPLFELSGLHFLSLQKDGPAPPENFPLKNFMDDMADFADTAALIANLDLVISVDTAVAHLAAALGKPVWLLAIFNHCWRWSAGKRISAWYPTLRIYRQPRLGDWDPILAEIVGDLRGLAKM